MNSIDLDSTAFVTIDIQLDYFPGGRFPLWRPSKALQAARRVLDLARAQGKSVFHIRHESPSPASTFLLPNTEGVKLHPGLGIPEDGSEVVILKHQPDSFYETDLEARLREKGVERVVWMGMMTWMCVDTTVRSAFAHGFRNILVEDACASGWMTRGSLPIFPWTSHRAFVAALGFKFAEVIDSRQLLAAASASDRASS